MKKQKILLILCVIFLIVLSFISPVNAHSIKLDPESLISFPLQILDGKVNVTIKSSVKGYTLFYQAIKISNDSYNKIEEIENNGENELNKISDKLEKSKTEYENARDAYREAYELYEKKLSDNAGEDELQDALSALKTAQEDYSEKTNNYNTGIKEYNDKLIEIYNSINDLIPTYTETSWKQTNDGKFEIDLSQFSGNKAFAIWVKLVTADGKTYYDTEVYTNKRNTG